MDHPVDKTEKEPLYEESMISDKVVEAVLDHTWSGGFDRNGSHSAGEYVEYEQSFHNPGEPRSAVREMLKVALKTISEEQNRDWEQAAMQFHDGMLYYRSLLVRIGEIIGPDARVDDEGKLTDEVLVAKLPECVMALTEEFDLGVDQQIGAFFSGRNLVMGQIDPNSSHGKDKLGQAVDLIRDLLLHDDGTAEARATRFVLTYQKERNV